MITNDHPTNQWHFAIHIPTYKYCPRATHTTRNYPQYSTKILQIWSLACEYLGWASQEANVEGNKVEYIDISRFWRWIHSQVPINVLNLVLWRLHMWLTIFSIFSKPFGNNLTSTTLASSYKGITWNTKYANTLEPIWNQNNENKERIRIIPHILEVSLNLPTKRT